MMFESIYIVASPGLLRLNALQGDSSGNEDPYIGSTLPLSSGHEFILHSPCWNQVRPRVELAATACIPRHR